MAQEIIKEVIKKSEEQKLLKIGVYRSENGIEIFAQSQAIETFFKKYGVNNEEIKWAESYPYNYPTGFEDNFVQMFHYWKKSLFVGRNEQSTPNLSFLRAEGLGQGKSFIIADNIYSKAEINKFIKLARESVKKFYDQYMKPVNVTVEIVFTIKDSD